MATFGILANLGKPEVPRLVGNILTWAAGRHEVLLLPEEAAALGHPELGVPVASWQGRAQLAVVLGGDGTLLTAARLLAPVGVPLAGVNLGRLGFLTELEPGSLLADLEGFLRGEAVVEERMMLSCRVHSRGTAGRGLLALNDVVIAKGPFARLVHLEVRVDGQLVATYPADGLIVATPTGSTAYSLSAGGPVVAPNVDSILLTPICPHSLSARPLVVSARASVRVRVVSQHLETLLTVDGQRGQRLLPGDEVVVEQADHGARLLRRPGWNFFRLLMAKLLEAHREEEEGEREP